MLGAAARGEDPTQATYAQHQVLLDEWLMFGICDYMILCVCFVTGAIHHLPSNCRGLTRARAGPTSLPPDLGELVGLAITITGG